MTTQDGYVRRVLIAFDEAWNVVFGGNLNETISTRAAVARAERRPWGCILCRFLDWVSRGHCDRSLVGHEDEITP